MVIWQKQTNKKDSKQKQFGRTTLLECLLIVLAFFQECQVDMIPWKMHFSWTGVAVTFSSWSWRAAPQGRLTVIPGSQRGIRMPTVGRNFKGLCKGCLSCSLQSYGWAARLVNWLRSYCIRVCTFLDCLCLTVGRCFFFLTDAQFTSMV